MDCVGHPHFPFDIVAFHPTRITLPETLIAPENVWLEDDIFFWEGLFQGRTVSFSA